MYELFFFPYHLTEGSLNLFLDERLVLQTAWDVNIISILLCRAVLLASLVTSPLISEQMHASFYLVIWRENSSYVEQTKLRAV